MIWRVRSAAEFTALRQARRHRSGPLSLRAHFGDVPQPPRVAYAISRHFGTAVDRNRIRRRLRAYIRGIERELRSGASYLIVVSPAASKLTQREIEHHIFALIARSTAAPAMQS